MALRRPIVPDNYEAIKQAIAGAEKSDANLVVINAGSSADGEDYTAAAISELGEVLVHGVASCGKPTILGIVGPKACDGATRDIRCPAGGSSLSRLRRAFAEVMGRGCPRDSGPLYRSDCEEETIESRGERNSCVCGWKSRGSCVSLPKGAGSITTPAKRDGILRNNFSHGRNRTALVDVELLRPADR